MNGLKVVFLILFFILLDSSVQAGNDASTKAASAVVKKYAKTIGCLMELNVRNIVEYDIDVR